MRRTAPNPTFDTFGFWYFFIPLTSFVVDAQSGVPM
jgi:hypothetical protein